MEEKKKIVIIGNTSKGKSLAYELAKNKCGLPIVVGRSEQLTDPTENCVKCGGLIQSGAKVCKHCSGDWVS